MFSSLFNLEVGRIIINCIICLFFVVLVIRKVVLDVLEVCLFLYFGLWLYFSNVYSFIFKFFLGFN